MRRKIPLQHTLGKAYLTLIAWTEQEVTCNNTKVLLKLPGITSVCSTALRLYQRLKQQP